MEIHILNHFIYIFHFILFVIINHLIGLLIIILTKNFSFPLDCNCFVYKTVKCIHQFMFEFLCIINFKFHRFLKFFTI